MCQKESSLTYIERTGPIGVKKKKNDMDTGEKNTSRNKRKKDWTQ